MSIDDRPHYVYRAFDSYGHLLYVGCTVNPTNRLAAHRAQSPWFRFAETIGISSAYPDKGAARTAETEAIESERPYFNATRAETLMAQTNRVAARQAIGIRYGDHPDYRRVTRRREALKATTHPYVSDADRLARYLAAREDAELARREAAA